jgi:hypothetical protein
MDVGQLIILVGAGVVVLFFLKTPYAQEPVKLHNPDHAAPGGFKALVAVLVGAMALYVGAMATGAASTGGYRVAVAAGNGEAFLIVILVVAGLWTLASEGILTKVLIPIALAIMVISVLWKG